MYCLASRAVSRPGVHFVWVLTRLISSLLRHMRTPVETANVDDIEKVIRLICAFGRSLKT
jgi:putative aminopeptidase FrvX